MWGSAAKVTQRGTEWALSPQKNGRAGRGYVCSRSFICGTIILDQRDINPCVFCVIPLQKLLSFSFQTSNLYFYCLLQKEISYYRSVLEHLSFHFLCLFTSSEGPRVSNKYWSTKRDHPGAHPEQPVHHMSGWNEAILQSRQLHQRMGWADHGYALQAAWTTSDCVTLLFWTQLTQECLKGDPTVRWGDKSYNLIVCSDGTFGSNCDVSCFTPHKGSTHIIDTFLGGITSFFFGSMRLMMPWCWWACVGMWTRKFKAQAANGRWSPLWSLLLFKVTTSTNDMLIFLRDRT